MGANEESQDASIEIPYGSHHALRRVDNAGELDTREGVCDLGEGLGQETEGVLMVLCGLVLVSSTSPLAGWGGQLTTRTSFMAPQARATYSGWCCTNTSMILA